MSSEGGRGDSFRAFFGTWDSNRCGSCVRVSRGGGVDTCSFGTALLFIGRSINVHSKVSLDLSRTNDLGYELKL